MATFTHTIPVEVPPAQLWALVRDVKRISGLFSYTTVEDMQTPEPGSLLFWRQLTIPNVADLRWQEFSREVGARELHFHAVDGDLETFSGRWVVATDGTNATLSLMLEYAIPNHLTPNMPAFLVDYVVGEIFKSICQRMKEAAEEGV